MPFFAEDEILELTQQVHERKEPRCEICKLYKGCQSPKMPVYGKGKKSILVVGEAPGAQEDERGKPFVGKSGRFLDDHLAEVGIDFYKDCWRTNAIICRPEKNRTPTKKEIEYCRPNLTRTINELKPKAILVVGHVPLEAVLLRVWREGFGPMKRWVGWKIPCRDLNSWVLPTWHPSYLLREMSAAKSGTAIETIFLQHLDQLNEITGQPYETVPNIKSQIQCVTDTDEIVKILTRFKNRTGVLSFDYETNMLKPDSPEASIVTAAVSWSGKETIAFPMQGKKVIEAWKALMKCDNPKIGHNQKFEDRWTRKIFGVRVRNWVWDSMVQAHVLDPRKGICSLSFQGLIHCGVSSYANHISPLLGVKGKRSYAKNRVKEISLPKLLEYNGIDALLTYQVAMEQVKKLGFGPIKI